MRKWMAPWHMSKGVCVHVCVCAHIHACTCVAVLVCMPNTRFGTIWAGVGHLLLGRATHGPMLTHSVTAAM